MTSSNLDSLQNSKRFKRLLYISAFASTEQNAFVYVTCGLYSCKIDIFYLFQFLNVTVIFT